MKKLMNLLKKGMNWYITKYAECYDDRFYRYQYRVY